MKRIFPLYFLKHSFQSAELTRWHFPLNQLLKQNRTWETLSISFVQRVFCSLSFDTSLVLNKDTNFFESILKRIWQPIAVSQSEERLHKSEHRANRALSWLVSRLEPNHNEANSHLHVPRQNGGRGFGARKENTR